jgi:hypothetical protein
VEGIDRPVGLAGFSNPARGETFVVQGVQKTISELPQERYRARVKAFVRSGWKSLAFATLPRKTRFQTMC